MVTRVIHRTKRISDNNRLAIEDFVKLFILRIVEVWLQAISERLPLFIKWIYSRLYFYPQKIFDLTEQFVQSQIGLKLD